MVLGVKRATLTALPFTGDMVERAIIYHSARGSVGGTTHRVYILVWVQQLGSGFRVNQPVGQSAASSLYTREACSIPVSNSGGGDEGSEWCGATSVTSDTVIRLVRSYVCYKITVPSVTQ